MREFSPSTTIPSAEFLQRLRGETIGILAGWGRFPVVVAEAIKRHGGRTAILSIRDHASAEIESLADVYGTVGVAEIGHAVDFFRRHGAVRATMAGKIHKTKLFARAAWIRHLPDWRGLQTFWPHFISRRRDNRDDSLLRAITAAFEAGGVHMCPATVFAPELLAVNGLLAGRPLTATEMADVAFGWRLAKQLGQLDIGQTVVVKNRAPMALEAIEGTDDCIRRAGRLCASVGMVVVKVAKPQQDLRFDMPTIGVGTLQSLRAAGARVLAIEAGRTILVDADQLTDCAVRSGLTIASFFDNDGTPQLQSAPSAAA